MPITPLHFTAISFLYFLKERRFDPLALLTASTFIDLEIFYNRLYVMIVGAWPFGQTLHNLPIALTFYPLIVAIGVYLVERRYASFVKDLYGLAGLSPSDVEYSFGSVFLSSLIGGASHVILDAFTHSYLPYVFSPFYYGNPLWLGFPVYVLIYGITVSLSLFSLWLWRKKVYGRQEDTSAEVYVQGPTPVNTISEQELRSPQS